MLNFTTRGLALFARIFSDYLMVIMREFICTKENKGKTYRGKYFLYDTDRRTLVHIEGVESR